MRIVIDTNVVASAIFFGGHPRTLLEMLMEHRVDAYISKEILEEYRETIRYLIGKYPRKQVSVPLTQIISACRMIEPASEIKICRDPDDDKFIACALDAHCIYIVSGDKDLLSVRQYQGIQIVTVADFLARYAAAH